MGGLGAMLRTLARRSRAQWSLLLAAWLLLVSALTLVSAAVAYTDEIATGSLRHAVAALPQEARSVRIAGTEASAGLRDVSAAVVAAAADGLGISPADVALTARGSTLAPRSVASDDVSKLTTLAAYEGMEMHATLTAGRWAVGGRDPIEATLSEGAAKAMGIAAGATLDLVDRSGGPPVHAVVTGIWRPAEDDPYWAGGPLERSGQEAVGRYVYRGPLVVALDDLLATAHSVNAEWRAVPAPVELAAERIAVLQAGIAGLHDRLAATVTGGASLAVTSGLPPVLADAGPAILASRGSVLAVTAQFGVLGGYAVLLVAGIVLDRRRTESAQLRARGATSLHLAAMALAEAVLVAAAAAVAASYLAGRVVRLLAAFGPLGGIADAPGTAGATFLTGDPLFAAPEVAAVGAAIAVVALVIPSIASSGPLAGARAALSRQVGQTLAQRLGIDVVLAAVAAIALWQLRTYGAPIVRNARGVLGLDPLLVAAPALGLLAAAVVATRFGPRLAELAEAALEDGRSTLASLVSRQLGRRPLRYTRAALLLMLATALGTFAAAYSATWNRSQLDQAAYQAAADARTHEALGAKLPAWAEGPLYRRIPGIAGATPVLLDDVTVGRKLGSATLLGVDASAAPSLGTPPRESALLRDLAARRAPSAAVPLTGRPARLTIALDADLVPRSVPTEGLVELPPEALQDGSLDLAVVVRTPDGLHRFGTPRAAFRGAGQQILVDLSESFDGASYRPAYPLELESVEISIVAPAAASYPGFDPVEITGTFAIRSISSDAGQTVSLASAPGWRWETQRGGNIASIPETSIREGSLVVGGAGSPVTAWFQAGSPGSLDLRYAGRSQTDASELPIVASSSLLSAAGARSGDAILGAEHGRDLAIRIAGSTDSFAPLDADRPFAVVDLPTYELWRYEVAWEYVTPTDWWLGLRPGASGVAQAVAAAPLSATGYVERAALADSLTTDPIALGILAALGLGAAAALAIASIGFLMSAWVSATERGREFGILRALGLTRRSIVAWIVTENALLLAFGAAVGAAVGAGLAWLVLPFASLTRSGAIAVPAPVVVIPWGIVAPVCLVAAALLLLGSSFVARGIGRAGVAATIRAMEDI